eukprot:TRINITY_DN2113_c0_g1_i9.p1 TRINITY_DN2113_c0_g1~~TRINITY_DN2113_c0_g1_i9.p1  ORF type:complete len:1015 (+),score=166.76 TRINITY_DN2113_c0_g1_i9:2734-5778(+)
MSSEFRFEKNADRLSKYKKVESQYDFSGLEFPVKVSSINRFVNQNDVFINLFTLDDKHNVLPYGQFGDASSNNWINLLFFEDHYMWIKSLGRLMGCDSKHGVHCPRCLHSFKKEATMLEHFNNCKNNEASRVTMPKEGSKIKFTNYNNTVKKPFVMIADFESMIVGGRHLASSYRIHLDVSPELNWKYGTDYMYTYDPAIDEKLSTEDFEKKTLNSFYNDLQEIMGNVNKFVGWKKKLFTDVSKMIITEAQVIEHELSTHCCYCKEPFSSGDKVKVHDHCHLTGRYRGASCSGCNINVRDKQLYGDVPLYFHNARGYDNNHIWRMLGDSDLPLTYETTCKDGKKYTRNNLDAIKNNSETTMLISFKFKRGEYMDRIKVCVKDSLQLIPSSLDTLLKNLPNNLKPRMTAFMSKKLADAGAEISEENLSLLLSKGAFPYTWFKSHKRLSARELPPKKEWYDTLSDKHISKETFAKAKKIWNMLKMKSFKEYHDLYLAGDVLGLADVMDNYRNTFIASHRLDPVYYVSLSSYSWDAMLLNTNVQLDLISDPDMYAFFEEQKRGGLTMAVQRHVKANIPNTEDFDKNKEPSYLWYTDANNLYGWAMMKSLPYANFQWVKDTSFVTPEFIRGYDAKQPTGYAIEVDLDYPESLHKKHWDFPLAPYNRSVDYEELSPYQRGELSCKKDKAGHKKLICDFKPRVKQIYNIEYLSFLLDHGLVLKRVHRVVSYDQKPWLKKYIELNTGFRQQAKNEFEKDLYKLLNNAVYGKTLENVRGRASCKIVENDYDKLVKEQSHYAFKFSRVDIGNFCMLDMHKRSVTLHKPVYAGSQILDYSKQLMSGFFYDTLIPHYGRDNISLAYTDTDSFVLHIKTDDLHKSLEGIKDTLDTCNYPEDHPLYSNKHKKVAGYFKDETDGKLISEGIFLRAKTYAYTLVDEAQSHVKAKGVPRSKSATLQLEDFSNTLETGESKSVTYNSITSKSTRLMTKEFQRVALSRFDDKRYICPDGKRTLAYGSIEVPV